MSLRKPILKVTRECGYCKGSGSKTIKAKNYTKPLYGAEFIGGRNSYLIIDCGKCKGTGRVDVKRNDPRFKKYYKIALEERVEDLTIEYRNAKAETFDIGEELRKYCKELDKVINK